MIMIPIRNWDWKMQSKILKFENKVKARTNLNPEHTYHLSLQNLNAAENFLVWMTQYWCRTSIQKMDPLPLMQESVLEILNANDQEKFVHYTNYICYLFLNVSSYPLTLGCQECKKLGSFELNLMALVSFQQKSINLQRPIKIYLWLQQSSFNLENTLQIIREFKIEFNNILSI